MLPIKDQLANVNEFSRPGIKLKGIKGIVMHYTASPGAPAINIANYFKNLGNQNPHDNVEDRYAGAHYSVDKSSIVRSIPDGEMGYHCGSTTYTKEALAKLGSYPNNCTIGIEMCIETNGAISEMTFQNAADLAASLLKKYGLSENDIWTHKGVVGWKDCPLPWVQHPQEFTRFKAEVASRLRPQAVATYPEVMVQVEGKPLRGIVHNNTTYIIWPVVNAQFLNVPNEYLGNGLFKLNGRQVKGIIYKGDTYLPWNQVLPDKLKATKLPNGMWNFVR